MNSRKMKGPNMSKTLEAIAAHLVPMKRPVIAARAKQLTANWQNGFEAGGHMQRKLRLTLGNRLAHQPA
jgi:hypothetical protein